MNPITIEMVMQKLAKNPLEAKGVKTINADGSASYDVAPRQPKPMDIDAYMKAFEQRRNLSAQQSSSPAMRTFDTKPKDWGKDALISPRPSPASPKTGFALAESLSRQGPMPSQDRSVKPAAPQQSSFQQMLAMNSKVPFQPRSSANLQTAGFGGRYGR